jgi:hypothetical protein|tara:strand:+ start:91 stop:417 length:327 start_codon:yes stop_codon:yes gene_type:complete
MAGTFSIKALGEGQLAASKGTIYTTPVSTQTIIKTMTLVNTSAGALTCNLYIKAGLTSRRIIPKDLSLGAGQALETDTDYTLEAGDLIEGDASSATSIDYTISGIEET